MVLCSTMTCKVHLRPAAVVLPIILLCAIAGCGRRPSATPPTFTPPAATVETTRRAPDTRPDTLPPVPRRREVAILFKSAAGYTEVVAQLRKLLSVATYSLTLVDVDAENSRTILDSLRGKPGLLAVAISLPAARIARDQLNVPIIFAQVFNHQELLVNGNAVRG